MPTHGTPHPTQQPGRNIVVSTTVELVGVGILALLAGISEEAGSTVVVFMVGLLVVWLLLHVTELANIVGKL